MWKGNIRDLDVEDANTIVLAFAIESLEHAVGKLFTQIIDPIMRH